MWAINAKYVQETQHTGTGADASIWSMYFTPVVEIARVLQRHHKAPPGECHSYTQIVRKDNSMTNRISHRTEIR